MALGIPTSSGTANGEIKPRIEYDARAGRFFRIDRSQDAQGNWSGSKQEIPTPFKLALDLENIRVGWLKFANGVDMRLVKVGQPLPPKPDGADDNGRPTYKGGFQVDVYNKNLGARVWNHTAKCVVDNMDALHNAFTGAVSENPGKVPVVEFKGAAPIQSGQSTNYAPIMAIVDWIDRPDCMKQANGNGHANGTTNGNGHAAQQDDVPAPMQEPVPPPAAQQQTNAVGSPDF